MDSFDISLDHENRIVRVMVTGKMDQNDGEAVITAARKSGGQYRYDILYDIRQATTEVPFANWFHLPRKLEVFQEEKARLIKAAVLCSPNDKAFGDYKFYEVVTHNLGFKLRVSLDEKEAIAWILEDRTISPS